MTRNLQLPKPSPVIAWGMYLAAVVLGSALLAPWIYLLARALAPSIPALQGYANHPFHRYVQRTMLVLALVGLWPLLSALQLRSWSEIGLVPIARQWRRVALGCALGLCSLAFVVLGSLAAGTREGQMPGNARVFLVAAATALVVALMEEVLFRGALFGSLRKSMDWHWGAMLSSAIYALVHFFQRPTPPDGITWSSGLDQLAQMLHGFVDPELLVPSFLSLMVAGLILALAYQRTGNLWFSIGLHAGWIFWLKCGRELTRPAAEASSVWWGGELVIDGWFATATLLGTLWVTWRFLKRSNRACP